jgi:ABC-type uncharacterized transport system substrate-binding protein
MKKLRNLNIITISALGLALLLTGLHSCGEKGIEKKKVVYVNSYHRGFPPSDQITEGVYEVLPADSFEILAYFIDSKRNPIPIVFCGINWTADKYDLSGCNITGILEMLPVPDLVQTLKPYYPGMKRLLVLNENTTTSRKTKPILDTLLGSLGLEVTQALVDDFDRWKEVFEAANQSHDIIYLQTRGAIKGWDHDEALEVIDQYIKVPLVTCEDFMMPYTVFGLTQVSKEQGMVAAEKAKQILNGTNPSDIPVSRNQISKVWINFGLAEKIGFLPDEELLNRAKIVE